MSLLSYFCDIFVGVRPQRLLILPQILQTLILNEEPSHTQPLLEQSTAIVKVVQVIAISDIDMEGEVLTRGNSLAIISLS